MGLTIDKLKLPILNFEMSEYEDNRFKKVKIWIAHTGENLNNTSFSLDALKSMSNSLPYTPIVGYVEKNSLDEDDFSDHRQRITIEKNDIKVEYLCQPFGFIPEDSNTSIEYREGKEWLTADGFLWTKFEKGIDIISGGNGRKSQSMEIDSVEGYVTDEGVLDITNARFSALCILGDETAPAMTGSTIEMFSSDSGFKKEMKQMLAEFSVKGANEVDKDKLKDIVAEEEVDKSEEVTEEKSAEEVVETEDKATEEKPEAEVTEEVTEEEVKEEDKPEEDERIVEETVEEHGEVDESIDTDLAGRGGEADTNLTDGDVENNNFEAEKEVYESRIAALESELTELRSYKTTQETAEKESLLSSYADRLGKKEMEEFKKTIDTVTLSELEKEIAYTIIKAEKETDNSKSASVSAYSFKVETANGEGSYGELDKFFK